MNTLQILVEKDINSGEYVLLDLMEDENVFLNFKYKDSKDIAKAFSTYSQSFSIPASNNNILALNYEFSTDLIFNRPDYINCKIYINSKLFKVGFIKVIQAKYKGLQLSTFQLDFFTAITSMKDIIGEALIGNLTGNTYNVSYDDDDVFTMMTTNDDIIYPLISNNRLWAYADTLPATSDIKYYNSTTRFPNAIIKDELRPAIRMKTIMDLIIDEFDLKIECPLFDRSEFKDLYVWCNADLDTMYGTPVVGKTFDIVSDFKLTDGPAGIYDATANLDTNIISVHKSSSAVKDTDGFEVQILVNNPPKGVTAKVTFINETLGHIGEVLYSATGVTFIAISSPVEYTHFFNVSMPILSGQLNPGNPLLFRIEIEFSEPVAWYRGQLFLRELDGAGQPITWESDNQIINTILAIPSMKIIDFLSSVFKMFSISIVEDTENRKMKWLTPQEFYVNGIEIDYTPYGDITELTVKKQDKYGKYIFQHKEPNYSSSIAFKKANVNNPNEKQFGQLIYDTQNPYNKNEYKLETNFSIMVPRVLSGTNIETYYGFTDAEPVLTTNVHGNWYKYTPNNNDFTIFYVNGLTTSTGDVNKTIGIGIPTYDTIDLGYYKRNTDSTVSFNQFNRVKLINGTVDFVHFTNYTNSIAWKDEVEQDPTVADFTYTKTLYKNYYENQILELINPRIFLYTWKVILPTFEINRFSLQNTVVIGNMRYKIVEAQLNLTNGECSLVLQNIIV